MIFHREVTGKFNRKLLFSSEIAKAEVIIIAGQTERKTNEFIIIWFKLISNRDFNEEKHL